MDDANDLSRTEDSIMNDSESCSGASGEAAAQENEQSHLVQSVKDYQNKSPEEVAAILSQFQELKEQYIQEKAEHKQLRSEYYRLHHTMMKYQGNYAISMRLVPSTISFGRSSAEDLQLFEQALDHENKAGETIWKIYEMQKRMDATCNAIEDFINFREEQFMLEESEQQILDEEKIQIATSRHNGRRLGSKHTEFDVESEYDPACRSLREQSQKLKWSFKEQSTEYDMLKYEFRRVTVIYDTYFRRDYNTESTILATKDISEVDTDTLRSIQVRLDHSDLDQKQFFGRYIERAKAIFEQLEILYESSDVLLDRLRVLHYPVDEVRHIARRDKLFHAQKSLDFVIKELHEQVSEFLSSRLAVSFGRDVPLQNHEATENTNLERTLRAELPIQLGLALSRFQAMDRRHESTSAQLTQIRTCGYLLPNVTATLRRMSGESELAIQATDAQGLSLVQSGLLRSDAIKMLFDLAVSDMKACCDGLDRIEQEAADFLKSFGTISAGFKTALTADEINLLHTLRCIPGEARLRKAKILTKVRSYW
ncbi:hypothetical protein KCU95_g13495, partial [Aureobasidium melanogenum]